MGRAGCSRLFARLGKYSVMRQRDVRARHGAAVLFLLGMLLMASSTSAQAGSVRPRATATKASVASHVLSVVLGGSGSGTVISDDGPITCGSTCSAPYEDGTAVTLRATPASGSTFAGWSGGGCSGTGSCVVNMIADTTVTATFSRTLYTLTLAKTGPGSGSITSTDGHLSCGSTCKYVYGAGTVVTLTAAPGTGSTFGAWSGANCTGVGSCILSMTGDTTVTGEFQPIPPSTTITGVTVDQSRHVVTFRFRTARRASGFECGLAPKGKRLDFIACKSPWSYGKLVPGTYWFAVRPLGRGEINQTAARRTLTLPIEFFRCWGAASRDPEHPCRNPALTDLVFPTPDNALLIPLGYCFGQQATCTFGVNAPGARGTVALIGDSHAAAWLPAMLYVARANGWHGLAYGHNGCGFSEALMMVDSTYANQCHIWEQAVMSSLWQHPEVSTVVITGLAPRPYVSSPDAGFHRIWNALPPWIHRIFIIRDVPHAVLGESDCVQSASGHHQPAATRCAQPRSATLMYDSEAAAALDSKSRRVHLLDFTPIFCDSRSCFPVIGGVLVLKDLDHMTREFSATLGPYLLRAINRIR